MGNVLDVQDTNGDWFEATVCEVSPWAHVCAYARMCVSACVCVCVSISLSVSVCLCVFVFVVTRH